MLAPASASAFAITKPSPRVLPVIRATRPSNLNSSNDMKNSNPPHTCFVDNAVNHLASCEKLYDMNFTTILCWLHRHEGQSVWCCIIAFLRRQSYFKLDFLESCLIFLCINARLLTSSSSISTMDMDRVRYYGVCGRESIAHV